MRWNRSWPPDWRQIAEFVEDDEVHAGQVIGKPSLPRVAGFGLEPIDEIDHVVEPTAAAGSNATSGDGDCQVGFAGAGSADQNGIALVGDESTAGEVAHQRFIDWRLAMVSWYLIERACFSLISAVSRSPTVRWGSCWRLTAVVMISSKAAFMP